jgi:hypothetical protein
MPTARRFAARRNLSFDIANGRPANTTVAVTLGSILAATPNASPACNTGPEPP